MTNVLDRVEVVEVEETVKPRRQLKWNWEHAALGSILLLAAFLGLWNLSINGYSNSYYAAAIKSMVQSWHNFFFVSFDPGGFVTVDKPPIAFWVQAAFVKIFGYSGVSMLLPEALAGVGGVFFLYLMVKRAFGSAAGLISALLLAITPIYVVMNRDNNPDSILVFTLILAAWAMLRAADKGSLRWLLLAGALVGIAFNVKMLAAYVVLPAFFLMYFLFARTTWLKRIIHLAAVSVVIVAISLSWAVAVDLTPASSRPYVDSSSVNSELDLILNYNGLGRVDGNENGSGTGLVGPANATSSDNSAIPTAPATGSTTSGTGLITLPDGTNFTPPTGARDGGGFGGEAGITRLITPQNAAEFNWFMPLALLGMTFAGAYTFLGMAKGEERSRRLQSLMLWGGWFVIYGLVFSLSKGTFHSYYLNMMAPAEAALAGIALVMLWRRYRQGGWLAWLLPIGLAATAFYQAYILTGYTSWNSWLSPILIVVGICTLLGLAVGKFLKSERSSRILVRGVTGVSVAALLVTPTILSVRAVFTAISGSIVSATPNSSGTGFGGQSSSNNAISTWLTFIQQNLGGQLLIGAIIIGVGAGLFGLRYLLKQPRLMNKAAIVGLGLALLVVVSSGWWVNAAQAQPNQTSASTSSNRDGGGIGQINSQTNATLIKYLEDNQGDYQYLVAVSNSNTAAPLIIETGKPVMSIGGFLGSDKTITSTAQLEQMIANHTIRYFLIGGGMGGGGQSSIVSTYVQANCTVVNYSASGSSSSQTTGNNSQQLYVCTAK